MEDRDDEFETFTFSHAISAVIILAFGWGIFWAGQKGAVLAWDTLQSSNANYHLTAASGNAFPTSSPSPSQTASVTQSPTVTSTPTPSNTPTNSPTTSPTPSAATTYTPIVTNTSISSATYSPVSSPTPSATATYSPVVTQTPTASQSPTQSPRVTPTYSPVYSPNTTANATYSPVVTSRPTPTVTKTPTGTSASTNTSSGTMYSNSTTRSTTPTKPNTKVIPESSLTVMIGGDVMLDRKVRLLGMQNGYDSLFAKIAHLFKSADIVAVNLEGPITSYRSKTLLPDKTTTKELTFTFDPAVAQVIANAGITVVNLANNHSDNFGISGITETKKWLSGAGLKWFGNSENSAATETVITKNNISVAFVGYHAFQSGFDRVLESVKRLSAQGDFVIVMPHWGDEYEGTSTAALKSKARLLVAAGADAIMGSHSHVIMDHVMMGGVPVYYSLGNLLFDQYFSPEVMVGNVVELKLATSARGVVLKSLKVYKTSTASKTGTTLVNDTPGQ